MAKIIQKLTICIAVVLFSISLSAQTNKPSFVAKIKLGFQNKLTCNLSDFNGGKGFVKGRSNIIHDENSISWTTTCVIRLPTTVTYCVISSQEVANPDSFLSRYSGFQKSVIRAKIVSESDVNPDFGTYSVTYHCFE